MWTRRWFAILKIAAGAGAVLVLAIIVRHFAMSVDEAPQVWEPRPTDPVRAAEHAAERKRVEYLENLHRRYKLTCDAALVPELVRLLREDGQPAGATSIETQPCRRSLPSCQPLYDSLQRRLRDRYAFSDDRTRDFTCRAIVVTGPSGNLEPAFAVSITGRPRGKNDMTFRGVISTDGDRDLVSFELAPVSRVVGTADLDRDHRDEIVMVGGTRLTVTRIDGDRFIDLDGPTLPEGCQALANIEAPLNDGAEGRESLVITVEDPHPRKGCPATGRHLYVFDGVTIREVHES